MFLLKKFVCLYVASFSLLLQKYIFWKTCTPKYEIFNFITVFILTLNSRNLVQSPPPSPYSITASTKT